MYIMRACILPSCNASSKGCGDMARYAEITPNAACRVLAWSQIGVLSCSSSVGIVNRNSFKKVFTRFPLKALGGMTRGSMRITFSKSSK